MAVIIRFPLNIGLWLLNDNETISSYNESSYENKLLVAVNPLNVIVSELSVADYDLGGVIIIICVLEMD